MNMTPNINRDGERGIALITTLVLIMILTLVSTGLYYRGIANQKSSLSDLQSTQSYYLAESALNYMVWALYSDTGNSSNSNSVDLDGDGKADRLELLNNVTQSGNADLLPYMDTRALANRNYLFATGGNNSVNLSTLAANLPTHLRLDLTTDDSTNNVAFTVSTSGTPAGDGVVVWLTPATTDANADDSDDLSSGYNIYGYAIAYIQGQPKRLLRAQIGSATAGIPSDLGSITNSFR